MERQKNVWTPNEIKQKEVVWFHFMGRPVTQRHLLFLIVGIILSISIYMFSLKIIPVRGENFQRKLENHMPRIAISLLIVFLSVMISSRTKEGRYREEILLTRLKYKNNSSIILNQKAFNGKQLYSKGGINNDKQTII